MRRDLATRQDTSGDQFLMVIEGQEIRDRGIAGELLLRRAERMRGTHSDRQVASIAGFQVFLSDNFMQGPEIVLKGATTYTARVTDTALGTIRSVEHAIQHIEDLAGNLVQSIEEACKGLADTQAQVNSPFEYRDELTSLVRRQREIEEGLDLSKNQAPSGQDSKAGEPPSENEAPSAPEPQGPALS